MKSLGRPKVILDTNVFLSAILFGGVAKKVVMLAEESVIEVIVSEHLKLEILSKLRDKFRIGGEDYSKVEEFLSLFECVEPEVEVDACRDPKDNFLLELAETVGADYLVTGDKDVLVLKRWKGTRIVKIRDFMSGF